MYHIPLLLWIKKTQLWEAADSGSRSHKHHKQKSWDSPKRSTSRATALNHSCLLQALCRQILFSSCSSWTLLSQWSLTILPTPAPPGCGSSCRPLYRRKVDQTSNSSSSSVGRFLIDGYFTALEADGQWLRSRTSQLMDKEVDTIWGSPGASMVKNLPAKEGDTCSIPDPGRSYVPWSN